MKIKDFFEKHDCLRLSLQHQSQPFDGYWCIRIYNTTADLVTPIFQYNVLDCEFENANVDFETIIMTVILNWYEKLKRNGKEHNVYV